MDENTDLSLALVTMVKAAEVGVATQAQADLRGNLARESIRLATQWPASWVAKCIIFLVRSFFLFDPTGAMEVFGGQEKLTQMMQAGGIEARFLRGYGATFRQEPEAAFAAFRAADAIKPNDPFVQFSFVFALNRFGRSEDGVQMLGAFAANHRNHPLQRLAEQLFARK